MNIIYKVWTFLILLLIIVAVLTDIGLAAKKKRKMTVAAILTNITDCCQCDPNLYLNLTYVGRAEYHLHGEFHFYEDIENWTFKINFQKCTSPNYNECEDMANFGTLDFCESKRQNRKDFFLEFLMTNFEPPFDCPLKKDTYIIHYTDIKKYMKQLVPGAHLDRSKDEYYRYTLRSYDSVRNKMLACVHIDGYLKDVKAK